MLRAGRQDEVLPGFKCLSSPRTEVRPTVGSGNWVVGGFGIWSGIDITLGSMGVIKSLGVCVGARLGVKSCLSRCDTIRSLGFKYSLSGVSEQMCR